MVTKVTCIDVFLYEHFVIVTISVSDEKSAFTFMDDYAYVMTLISLIVSQFCFGLLNFKPLLESYHYFLTVAYLWLLFFTLSVLVVIVQTLIDMCFSFQYFILFETDQLYSDGVGLQKQSGL